MNAPAVLLRAGGFLALWLVLAGVSPGDLPAAAVAVVAATWVSLRLSPPAGPGLSLPGLALLVLRFPGQSLLAGIDVAMRVLRSAPAAECRTRSPTRRACREGPARDAFTAYASLMPGTVPVTANAGDAAGIS